uniref:Ficolin-2 n=1 Tax=Magallana gigas TaxID=29159 RepID=K1QJJ8_MAGGI
MQVFQHRRDGSVNFYRLWDSYKNGFGEASGEHWIGNDHLHKLTFLGTTDLYVRLEAFSGLWYYAKYSDFKVADESDEYRLSLKAGSYEGNAVLYVPKCLFILLKMKVFQHRRDGSVNFYRQWDSYKNGFGEASGEHWIGNDNLHKLTTLGTTELYVRLEAFSGDWYYAKYGDFKVADESDGYRLSLKAGSYEGNAGDGMDNHGSTDPSGMKFSTIDRDNDNAPALCTFARQGAWWYNQCTLTNLNGIYGNGTCLTTETCNFWYLISSSYVGVKTSYIMVRRLENQFYCASCKSSK